MTSAVVMQRRLRVSRGVNDLFIVISIVFVAIEGSVSWIAES